MQRPELEIYFDEKETYHICEHNKIKKLGIFVQVMVKNSGQIDAKKCTAELMNVEKQNIDGNFYRVESFLGPVSLKWSHVEDYTDRDIDCKYPRKLDILFTIKNDDKFYIYTKEFSSGVKTIFSPGIYKIEIRVSADNIEKSTYGEFIIYWDGNWENIRMDQYSRIKESLLLKKEYKENIPKIQSEVNILEPIKGTVLLIGQKYIFKWQVSDSIKDKIIHFNLLLLIDDGEPEYMNNYGKHSGYLPADSRNWEWIVNANPTKNAKVRLLAMLGDKENRVDESDYFIIYEKTYTEAPLTYWRYQTEKREKLKTKSEEQIKTSIFLCHNSKDKEFVRKLAKDLQNKGIKYWIDEAEMLVGDALILKISKAIKEMEYLGAILSPNSIKSNWVKKELSIAMTQEIEHKRVIVLPILYKKCKIPNFLKDKIYADFTKNYQEGLFALLRRLMPNMKEDDINNFEKEMNSKPIIKYVDIGYPADIGLKKQYEDQGYRIRWFSDNRVIRKIEIEGWEYAYQKSQNGKLFILKIKDRPYDQTLLKKKQINLEVLLKKYNTLRSLAPTNKGHAFEKILFELLNIYNMNPKLNLILPGEQIDFSFSFENQTYLGEARYRKKKPTIGQIGGFQTKVTSKGGYPLGLFVSISVFTANVLDAYDRSKEKVIILMDGNDLLLILKGAITFPEALKLKKRALSEGQVFFPLNNINK